MLARAPAALVKRPVLLPPARVSATRGLRVAVGVSGGVDSSVAAKLLRDQGHEVLGVHMTNWDASDESGFAECPQTQDRKDAREICAKLQLPLHEVSFVREYWTGVFEPFLEAYAAGFTPNPDVYCNREIKFDCFAREAERLGCDAIATGHYARLDSDEFAPSPLRAGADPGKDQSYFLSMVRRDAFSKALFPLGGLHKARVRAIAAEAGLPSAAKKDSVGICFVGKRDFGSFLSEYVPMQPGDAVALEGGHVVGRHEGLARYAVGQGARLAGQAARYFAVGKDLSRNALVVAAGRDHPALFRRAVVVPWAQFNWIGSPPPGIDSAEGAPLLCRVRHLSPLRRCRVRRVAAPAAPRGGLPAAPVPVPAREGGGAGGAGQQAAEGAVEIAFSAPVRAPGVLQIAALYDVGGEHCLGGGPITALGPSLWEELGAGGPTPP